MKNGKKLGIVILLVIALATLAAVAVFAVDSVYTGSAVRFGRYVNEANDYVDEENKVKEADFSQFIEKLERAYTYLEEKPVDPEEEAYAAAHKLYLKLICITVDKYIGDANSEDNKGNSAAISKCINDATLWLERGFVTDEDRENNDYITRATTIKDTNLTLAEAFRTELGGTVDVIKNNIASDDAQIVVSTGAKIKQLYNFMINGSFNEDDEDYKKTYSEAVELMAVYSDSVEKKRQELIWQAPLDEYGVTSPFSSKFDSGHKTPTVSNMTGVDSSGAELSSFVGTESGVDYDADGNELLNNYYTLRYTGAKASPTGNYMQTYLKLACTGSENGMIFEFDITTFDKLPSVGIAVEGNPGSRWLFIEANGDIGYYQADGTRIIVTGAIVPGAWTHISYVYNPSDLSECRFYIDYTFVGISHGDYSNKLQAPTTVRVGNTRSDSGEFSIDNVEFTVGTAFRDESFLDGRSNEDLFNYFVEYMQSSGDSRPYIDISDCVAAYIEASKYIELYAEDAPDGEIFYVPNEETEDPDDVKEEIRYYKYKALENIDTDLTEKIHASVDAYYAFDLETIKLQLQKLNLIKLQELANDIQAKINVAEPTDAAIKNLTAAYNAYEKFTLKNVGYIYDDTLDEGSPKIYESCNKVFAKAKKRIETDTIFLEYINIMQSFLDAVSLSAKERELARAEAIINAEDAPSFEDYITDEYITRTGYKTLKEHYIDTRGGADAIMAAVVRRNAAKKIIDYVYYIIDKYPEEEDWKLQYVDKPENELTEAEKENNADFEYIAELLKIVRNQINIDYDRDYVDEDGNSVDTAIEKISPMNEYYFSRLQDTHTNAIKAALDQFSASNSYIEKKGLLAWIERYLVSNEVDYTVRYHCDSCGDATGMLESLSAPVCPACKESVTVTDLTSDREMLEDALRRYLIYDSDIDAQEGSYPLLLKENTANFINCVKMFDTVSTYAKKKELYDQATPYYDVMNVGSPEAQAAIAVYDAMTAELKAVEDASLKFKECVLYLDACRTRSDLFDCLVEAKIAQKKYDTSIDGVEEALVKFNAALDSYNSEIETVNKQLSESGYALGSMVSNCGLSAIISIIIEKLFNFG